MRISHSYDRSMAPREEPPIVRIRKSGLGFWRKPLEREKREPTERISWTDSLGGFREAIPTTNGHLHQCF